MYYSPATEGGKVTPPMTIIKKQQKLAATFWDEVKHEKVDKLPERSQGVIKGVGDKKRITKVLKDCWYWKKIVQPSGKAIQGPDMPITRNPSCVPIWTAIQIAVWHNK